MHDTWNSQVAATPGGGLQCEQSQSIQFPHHQVTFASLLQLGPMQKSRIARHFRTTAWEDIRTAPGHLVPDFPSINWETQFTSPASTGLPPVDLQTLGSVAIEDPHTDAPGAAWAGRGRSAAHPGGVKGVGRCRSLSVSQKR